jgi:hypothetical protein
MQEVLDRGQCQRCGKWHDLEDLGRVFVPWPDGKRTRRQWVVVCVECFDWAIDIMRGEDDWAMVVINGF